VIERDPAPAVCAKLLTFELFLTRSLGSMMPCSDGAEAKKGKVTMTLKLTTTARKLKVTMMIDAAPFAALRAIPDSAPSRTELIVAVAGRTVTADIATKSVRKAVKTLTENGADKVVLIIQGVLSSNDRIEDAGISAQIKAPAEPQAA
jgi:hypothetical protein